MYGHTRRDKFRDNVFRDRVGVAPIEDSIRENKLRWLGHVKMRNVDAPVRRHEMINLLEYKSRGRPKKSWNEVIKYELNYLQLTEDMAQDRSP